MSEEAAISQSSAIAASDATPRAGQTGGAQAVPATRRYVAGAALVASLVSAAILAAYAVIARPAQPRLALLDVAEIYRLKEAQFETVIADPKSSDADRRRALDEAQAFGKAFEALLRELPQRCQCVLLNRSAVIGTGVALADLTIEAKRALGIPPAP